MKNNKVEEKKNLLLQNNHIKPKEKTKVQMQRSYQFSEDIQNKKVNQVLQQVQYTIPNGDNDDFSHSQIDLRLNNSSNLLHSEIKQSSQQNTINSLGDQDILRVDLNDQNILENSNQKQIQHKSASTSNLRDQINLHFNNEDKNDCENSNYPYNKNSQINNNIINYESSYRSKSNVLIIKGKDINEAICELNFENKYHQQDKNQSNSFNNSSQNESNNLGDEIQQSFALKKDIKSQTYKNSMLSYDINGLNSNLDNNSSKISFNFNDSNIINSQISNQVGGGYDARNKLAKIVEDRIIHSKQDCSPDTTSNNQSVNSHDLRLKIEQKTLKAIQGVSNFQPLKTFNKSSTSYIRGVQIINKQFKGSQSRQQRIKELVNKFIRMLKRQSKIKSDNWLTLQQHQLINDIIDYGQQDKHQISRFKYISKILQKLTKNLNEIQYIRVFMPSQTFKIIWDISQVIFHFIFFYLFSIYLFFSQNELESHFLNNLYYIFIISLIFDIIIVLNTAFYLQDQIITNRTQILKNYINSSFFFDIISLSCSTYICLHQQNSFVYNPHHSLKLYSLNIMIFTRSVGVSQKKGGFDVIQSMSTSQRHFIRLINQLLFMISFAHTLGIFWYLLGLVQENNHNQTSWLIKYNISNSSWYSKYFFSLYWAVTTMTTVGYGDISPANNMEALFNTISMILFSCVFAYSINNVGMILQDIEKGSKELKDNIITIQRYLKRRNVNSELKSRIKNYLYFLASETKERNRSAEQGVIQLLSNKLRDELVVEVNTKMIRLCSLFDKMFSQQTINKLIYAIQEIQVSPNEIIFNQNDIVNQSIYFILDGQIEIYSEFEKSKSVYKILGQNQYFGEYSFFSGISRKTSARSINLSTLCYLSREEFIKILISNNEDYQRYKMVQEQISVQGDISQLNLLGCFSCGQQDHFSTQCYQTHLQLDKQLVILKHNYFEFQERQFYQRLKKKANVFGYALDLIEDNKTYSKNLMTMIQQCGGDLLEKISIYNNTQSGDILSRRNDSFQETTTSDTESNSESEDQEKYDDKCYQGRNKRVYTSGLNIEDSQDKDNTVKINKQNKHAYSPETSIQQNSLMKSVKSENNIPEDFSRQQSEYQNSICPYNSQSSFQKVLDKKPGLSEDIVCEEKKKIMINQQFSYTDQIKKPNLQEVNIDFHASRNLNNSKGHLLNQSHHNDNIEQEKQQQLMFCSNQLHQVKEDKLQDLTSNNNLDGSQYVCSEKQILLPHVFKETQIGQKKLGLIKNKSRRPTKEDTHDNLQNDNFIHLLSNAFTKCITKNIETVQDEFTKIVQSSNQTNGEQSYIKLNQSHRNKSNNNINSQNEKSHFSHSRSNDVIYKKGETSVISQKPINTDFDIIENFDRIKVFSKFFPHNNIMNVLKKLKYKKNNNQPRQTPQKIQTAQKMSRRERVYLNFDIIQKQLQNFVYNEQTLNQSALNYPQIYNPTVLSYGINTTKCSVYPIKMAVLESPLRLTYKK